MDKVKTFFKENKALIIVGIILLIICVSIYFYDYQRRNKVYQNNGSSVTDTPYVKREYKANEYTNMDVELIDVLNDYYTYFIKKKYSDLKTAYALLSKESKEKYENEEKYAEYAKRTKTINSLTNKVKEYRQNPENKKAYDIIDSEGNKFTILEKAVWDIEVSDYGK